MSRDLTKKFYIKTTRSDIYGCGIHEIHLDGNDHFILRLENGSRTYMEPILTVLNTTLIQAFQAGYDEALRDNPPKKRRKTLPIVSP